MFNQFFFGKHLQEEETLARTVHKHWVLVIKALFWPTLCFLVLAYVLYRMPTKAFLITVACLDVVIVMWWLRNFFDYYLDVWLITDEGIIDIAWHGWFHRQSTRVLFSDIQGVSYEIQGVIGTLLQCGTVSVEKISTGDAISLECVKHPRSVESVILKNMEAYLHTKNLKDAKQVQEVLSTLVAQHLQMQELEENDDGEE